MVGATGGTGGTATGLITGSEGMVFIPDDANGDSAGGVTTVGEAGITGSGAGATAALETVVCAYVVTGETGVGLSTNGIPAAAAASAMAAWAALASGI